MTDPNPDSGRVAPAGPALARYWPIFGLRLDTPSLALQPVGDDDLPELVDLALAGVHDSARMPFSVPWTVGPPGEVARGMLAYFWRTRAELGPECWTLHFGVRRDGRLVGIQELRASEFAVTRSVSTGSWLGLAHQGQRIGTEMRCAVVQFAFDQLGATRAESDAFVDNPASKRVSLALGYVPDGTVMIKRHPGVAVLSDRMLLTPGAFRRPPWTVRVTGLQACAELLGVS